MGVNQATGERRKSRRYRLRLPVLFSWLDDDGVLQSGNGCSGDISSRGIYVHSKCAPPRGRSVEVNIFLPQPAQEIRAAEIHAKGHVTRVDRDVRSEVCGFAAMNRTVLIREPMEQRLNEHDSGPTGARESRHWPASLKR
jgi:hypothetical protein